MDWNLIKPPEEKEEKFDWTTIESPKAQPMGSQFGGGWGLSDLVKKEEKPPIEEGFKLE